MNVSDVKPKLALEWIHQGRGATNRGHFHVAGLSGCVRR